jgi:hypothetical protein
VARDRLVEHARVLVEGVREQDATQRATGQRLHVDASVGTIATAVASRGK